jgi:phosphonate transport system substrate-binding protein
MGHMSLNVCLATVFLYLSFVAALADERPCAFDVLNQRSIALTAQCWNGFLKYLSTAAAFLQPKMSKATQETTGITVHRKLAFPCTSRFLTAEGDHMGGPVAARVNSPPIGFAIVLPADWATPSLKELGGEKALFPSPEAFVAYHVPRDALLKPGVQVSTRFAGNREGAMAQSAVAMAREAGGKRIVEKEPAQFRGEDPIGLVRVDGRDYEHYRQFYETALVLKP